MNFKLNQDSCLKIIQDVLKKEKQRIEKIKKLCEFIQIDEGLNNEELNLLKYIDKQLNFLAKESVKALQINFKDKLPEKEIIFKVCESNFLNSFDGVIGIYGYINESYPDNKPKIKMGALPKYVNSLEHIVIILDIFHGVSIVPWVCK